MFLFLIIVALVGLVVTSLFPRDKVIQFAQMCFIVVLASSGLGLLIETVL